MTGFSAATVALIWLIAGAGAQTPFSPVESPPASGYFTAFPAGTLAGTGSGNGHVYSFEAEAGDEVTVWAECDAGSYPRVRIRNVGGTNLATVDGDVFGVGRIQAFEIPAPGTYTVLIFSDQAAAMGYSLRFDLGRAVDLESEGNQSIGTADLLEYSGLTSPFTLRMAGALEGTDYYSLGTLNAGNSLTLGFLRPASSTLAAGDGILTLRKLDGTAMATSATESLNYTVVDDGAYFLEVSMANLSGETMDFDGSNDYVDLGNPAELQLTGDTTIEFWIKPDEGAFNLRRNPWAKAYGGEGTFTLETNGVLNYIYGTNGNNGTPYQVLGSVKPLVGGQWTHVALVRRLDSAPQKLFFYLNGELVNEADAEYFPAVAGSQSALIGEGYVSPIKGEMDEVKVWEVARSAEEVLVDMSASAAGTEPGLVGYWKMEDRTVDPLVLTDETANGLDGTVFGAPGWGGESGSETFAAARAGREGLYLIEASITDGAAPVVAGVNLVPVRGHVFPGTTWAPGSVNSGGLRGNNGTTYTFTVQGSTSGNLWGTDVYTDDSSIAKAAVHAGILEPGELGVVEVTVLADAGSYVASTRNGVSSSGFGAYSGAFSVAAGVVAPPYNGLYSSVNIDFSETLDGISAANSANYEVRGAGSNGVFDDTDDVLYPVTAASFNGETSVLISFDGAPLQPESTRIRVGTGVVDRAGNRLVADHDATFLVEQVPGYVTEQGARDLYFGAAELGMTGVASQAGDGIWTYTTTVGDRPIGVELLHADADGILDLVAVHEYSDDVRVYPGLGDGNFGEGTSYPVGDRPLGMEAVDFDNDTLVDIVVPSFNGDLLALLKNNGDGSFTALASIGLADGPNQVKAGDFNGDAFPDLAVTNYNNGNGGYHISVLLGNGAAGFTEIEVGQGLSPAQRPRGLVIGDFDGINGDDMAVGDVNNDRVQIYLNDGAGGFLDPVPYDVDAADVWALETADFDENGTLDLVAAGTYRDRVSLLSGVGDGTFAAYTELVVGWPQEYRQFTVADFDQDGHKDLFLPGTTDLGYARGRGDGTFEPVLRYNSINQMQGIAVGDVNGDGYNDFVGGRVDSDQVLTFLGQPALPLLVDATESRAMHGFGRGFLTDTSDYDYFRFTAEAGQRLVVASEHPIAFGGAGLRIRVLDAAKNVYFSDNGEPTGNRGETNQITFSKTGSYFVEVHYNYQYFGEYRFRATLLEAPIAIESENNNAIGSADGVPLALGVGQLTGTVSGYISWGGGADYNNGDYWSIGNLGEGTVLTLDMSVPGISPLVPVMRIYRGSTEVAVSSPGDPQLSYAVGVGEADTYRFRVTQDGNTAGMSSAYIVDVTAADLVAPLVTMNNLPAEGSAGGFPGPNFSLTFSEDMLASTVNDLGNYELLGSGGDGTFGDGNEVAYTLMIPSAYGAGLGVGLRITDGPLQADDYRFRAMTGLSDKTNNPLGEEHVRLFTVEDDTVYFTEGRSNGSFGEAEPLAVGGEGAGFDQSFFRRYTTGSGIDSPHSPTLLHLDDTGVSGTADDVLDLVVVN
ncbi:MAG: FG-GAP-like repeat-containing protein, partial [Verrucomicrobiales bacterium]|nr:FG-GAP-like repeat-containing protein [Verrucomicrobiales bacterium]